VPNPRFAGRTPLGPRGDAIVQADWAVGEVLGALDRLKLTNTTLVIFTSDNGPVVDDGYKDEAVAKLDGHRPAGPFRGGKYRNFEGATRVPFIARWPGHLQRGVSDALVCQIDLLASLADLTGQRLAPGDGPDSRNLMTTLLGRAKKGRDDLVEQGSGLALRLGRWKYIEPSNRPRLNQQTQTELGNDTVPRLYDLAVDPGETTNRAARYPGRVKEMEDLLRQIRHPNGGR
jgi:arylsulfatase A-like enzyme